MDECLATIEPQGNQATGTEENELMEEKAGNIEEEDQKSTRARWSTSKQEGKALVFYQCRLWYLVNCAVLYTVAVRDYLLCLCDLQEKRRAPLLVQLWCIGSLLLTMFGPSPLRDQDITIQHKVKVERDESGFSEDTSNRSMFQQENTRGVMAEDQLLPY